MYLLLVLHVSLTLCCASSESSSHALSVFNKAGLLDVIVQCLDRHPHNVELAISAGKLNMYMLVILNILLYVVMTARLLKNRHFAFEMFPMYMKTMNELERSWLLCTLGTTSLWL